MVSCQQEGYEAHAHRGRSAAEGHPDGRRHRGHLPSLQTVDEGRQLANSHHQDLRGVQRRGADGLAVLRAT
eukprot:7999051-Pyramimonas_sp.AAC.1